MDINDSTMLCNRNLTLGIRKMHDTASRKPGCQPTLNIPSRQGTPYLGTSSRQHGLISSFSTAWSFVPPTCFDYCQIAEPSQSIPRKWNNKTRRKRRFDVKETETRHTTSLAVIGLHRLSVDWGAEACTKFDDGAPCRSLHGVLCTGAS